MASPQALGEAATATKEEISPHLDELLKDIATKLSAEELTNVVASIKTTFSGNFENQQDQDLYSCLQLFANQGLLSDQNLTLLERFVAWKSSKEKDIKERIEIFKLSRQLEDTPRQALKGREVELDAVFSELTRGKQPIVNLYGSGGLGKTTLGKEIRLKWPGKSVSVDLRGVTEMKDVYFHIMLALDTERTIIKYDENPVIEQLQKLKKESRSDVLLLLDNVDQFSGGDDYLAKGLNAKLIGLLQRLVDDDKDKDNFKGVKGNKGNVRLKVLLISRTRFRGLYADEHNYYELKPLDEGFSEEILRKTAGEFPSVEVNQMEKLVELCKGRPLFLNGIAAILRQRIATAEKVLESIEQKLVTSESQEKDVPLEEHGTQEREMWDLVSERLDEEQLPCLKKMFFLLPSDTLRYSAVAVSLFCRPFSEKAAALVLATDPSEAIILLEGLRSSEVLSVDPEAKELLYDMHPLMRSFLRSVGNGSRFKQAYTKAKDRFCKLYMTKMQGIAAMQDEDYVSAFEHFDRDKANFELALDISFKSDYLHVSREFHESIMVCHLFEAMLEDTRQREKIFKSWAEATKEDGKEGSLFRAEMRCFEALQVLHLQGWKSAAEVLKLAEDSLKIGSTSLNDTEPNKLAWSTYLYVEGEVYYRRGSVPRALKSLYLSLEIMEDLLKKHTSTARCLNAIGNCYNKLGNHEEALMFYQRAYEMRKELSGSRNHLDLPFYKGQIGTAYEGQKQYDKAIQCYQEALELSKQLKLSGILRLALFHRNIANAYAWKGKFEKAYKPAMDAYEIRKDILGDHPDTARSAFQVGQICKSLEDFDEAEEFLAEAWRIEKSLEHGNHSAVRDRIIQSYTFILRGDRKKEFQNEALEFYQRLWIEEREFSYENKSIIDEINKLLHASAAGDRKIIKKYEKEALQFYEMAWNSPDLQQLPHHQREDILQNILHLCNALREKELFKKYQGENLQFLEQQWGENKEMTTQDKIDILHTLQDLAARHGDERTREKYKMLYEGAKRGARFQKSIQSERLSGSEVVPSAIAVVGDSDGGNGGKIEMIGHGPESKEQFQVLEETKTIAAEETSTNRRSLSQEGASLGLEKLHSGIQHLPKQEGLGKNKCGMQGGTSQEEAKGIMTENAKESNLWSTTRAASGIITSEGGVVRVDGVQLVCPPGAVDNPVSIQITLEDPVKSYDLIVQRGLENDVMFAAPIVHLQPNGHLFKKPATLTTKIKIKEGDDMCEDGLLVLHGTEARDGKISWQDISQKSIINVTKKEVSTEIERFSLIANLLTLTRIRTKEIVSRLNLSPFNYTMSVLFKNNFSKHELALVFMSQDIFHEPYYRDHDASALVQLRNDGFKLLRSADGPTDKRIYNSESLRVSVCLGKDYKLPDNQQSSIDFTVESNVWWSTGHAIRLPLEAIKDVRILCGRIGVQGLYGHTSEYQFCEQDLKRYVKRLLGIEGAIFNLKPIAQKIGTPEETTDQAMKVWRDEDDQLEVLLQPWLKTTSDTEDLDNMRKCLEELNEKDYKVKQRGQMHIRHLRELADKISNSKIETVQLMQYFTEKAQTLCKSVLGDCCIELKNSVEDVEKAASSEDHVNYLEVHSEISQETASRYQQMCSLPEESIVTNFLGIVPHLIQDTKEIFRHEIMQDKQNGLRGLHKETLEQLATNVRETEQNNKILRLVCEVCKILEHLCLNNCDDQHHSKVIGKWGSSLGILPMLEFLKPFFQKCPQHIRLQKRLELFSCRIRDIMLDVVKVDEVFMRDFFDVSSSLVHFAKFDPAKLVRFHVTYSANSSLKCRREGLKYNRHDDTFSELFYVRKEEDGDTLLHAVAHVHVKGRDCKIGAFRSVITFPACVDADFERCMTDMASVNSVVVAKLQSKDSQNIQVVLCSPQKERLSLLLDNLKQELHDVVDWKGSQITQCHLTIRSSMPTKPGTVLSLSLKYEWKSEAISLESDDFVFHADSSGESACTPDVRFQGLRSPMKPDEAALSLEPFMSQWTQTHPQIRCDELKIEHHIHHTYVTGHNCMVGDQTTLNTQTSTFDQRSLQPGPSSGPLRSITDNTSPRESTSSER